MGAARRNPEALLLLAAGCCLLMRSGASSSSRAYSARYGEGDLWSRSGSNRLSRAAESATEYASGMKERASSAASAYAADVKDRISDTAGSYADTVSEFASDARRNISETTERFTRQAQSSMDRIMRDQPLAVALAGLAAGAAIAAVFPSTEIEDRTLGGAREALTDAAREAGQNLMGAAGKAGERLKSAAAERGLSAEGLKDMASDVAETFTSAAKGKPSDLGRATTVPENPSTRTDFAAGNADRGSSMAGNSEPGGRSNR
jgi:hypothetical protein